MRPAHALRFVLFVALLGTAGCASENKGKIEGTKWRSYASTVKGRSVPDGALWLHFKTDGNFIYSAGGQTFNGSYSLGPGKMVVMNMDRELAGRKRHSETIEIRGGRLTMTDSDGTSLTFYEDK